MIRKVLDLRGYIIHASDGDLGKVEEFYFDDDTWTIRYLVVQTGNWLSARRVLISPHSVSEADWLHRRIVVSLTQDQVQNSPDVDTDKPVSRQYEQEFNQYYGLSYYWVSPGIWEYKYRRDKTQNPHLRSTKEVAGYHIQAKDGEIGHAVDFLFDDENWRIQYMLIGTSNWWFGKKVIVAPSKIKTIDFGDNQIVVDLELETIRSRPEFNPESLGQ